MFLIKMTGIRSMPPLMSSSRRSAEVLHLFQAVILACICSMAHRVLHGQDVPSQTAWTDEIALRHYISKLEMPRYPTEDIRRGITGVAVAHVVLDYRGDVQKVEMLQAPSDTIASAVRDAVTRSITVYSDKSDHLSLTGKITFYFLRIKGSYIVRNPGEVPEYDEFAERAITF